jgi:amino acid adenylation domain-containing protein
MSILTHVLEAARRHPEAIALVDAQGVRTTYADLASAVDDLAASVRRRVGRGARVAIRSGKEPRTVVAMLAVLRAGCSYVPVDPSAPVERQRFIVEDAGCALALDLDVEPAAAREPVPDEAYVLYTSGSTGAPKGVVITHANAAAFVDWARRAFPVRVGDQVAVHAPLHFDLPVYDVFVGLAAGATLHPVPERVALFPQALHRFLRDRAITHLYAVPSALTALLTRSTLPTEGLPALKRVLYAGEEFRAAALAELMAAVPAAEVANLYGPIETNVITSHVVARPPDPDERVPVGRPVDGALIALLGADGTASFDGPAEGELVVAGPSVTPGYLGRPDLSAAATVSLSTSDGQRPFYRTGDIARRDPDGLLHLLGRRDGLVKTRGYRVEIGEVETAIGTHPDLAEVVVVPVPDPELTTRLHALVVPRPDVPAPSAAEVVAHCRTRLPGYMVPGAVHVVTDLPRTSTGKVARAELPALVTGEES